MEIIFILIPIALLFVAIAISLFFWAVRSEQFDDLDRQGYSILFDEQEHRSTPDNRLRQDQTAAQRDSHDAE